MAATFTTDSHMTVFGDKRVVYGMIDMAGVTSGAVDTGLDYVLFANICYGASYTSSDCLPMVTVNQGSAGTAINGYVYIASCTAGDEFKLFAFGNG
jgi:hypothetical protein